MKINKTFILSDSSVNCYGFRLLTSGYQLPDFLKNPIGYYMHGDTPEFPREAGVLVKWGGIKIEGDNVVGTPEINMSHPRAQRTIDEVNSGFLNAASFGHFVVLATSDDPALKLPGQTGPTVTKWFNRECSLVDVPGNFNALVLYDKGGNMINLSQFSKSGKSKEAILPACLTNLNSLGNGVPSKIDIGTQLSMAIADNDISLEVAAQLKEAHKDNPEKLSGLLKQLAIDRMMYLMDLPFSELDSSEMGEELHTKYLQGYKYKRAVEFLKPDEYAKQGLKDGVLKDQTLIDGLERNFGSDPEKHLEVLFQKIHENITHLMSMGWGELVSSGELDFLKANYLQGFKQKYQTQYGVTYKMPGQ